MTEMHTDSKESALIGPILWGLNSPLCHALSSSLLWTLILPQKNSFGTKQRKEMTAFKMVRVLYLYSMLLLVMLLHAD